MPYTFRCFVGVLLFILLGFKPLFAQNLEAELLLQQIKQETKKNNYQNDTLYYYLVTNLAYLYSENQPDSAIALLDGIPEKCMEIKYLKGEIDAYNIYGTAYLKKGEFTLAKSYFDIANERMTKLGTPEQKAFLKNNQGVVYTNQGNYSEAFRLLYSALPEAEKAKDKRLVGQIWNNIGVLHFLQGKYEESKSDFQKTLNASKEINYQYGIALSYINIGEIELKKDKLESANSYFDDAFNIAKAENNSSLQIAATKNLGYVFLQKKELGPALENFQLAYKLAIANNNNVSACKAQTGMARTLYELKDYKNALIKAKEAVLLANEMGQTELQRDAYEVLANIEQSMGQFQEAFFNFKMFKTFSDSLNNAESQKAAAVLKSEYDFSKKEIEFKQTETRQRWFIISALIALALLAIIFFIVNRNRKRAKLSNKILQQNNQQLEEQKAFAEETLHQLKTTQKQLIHSEKMASLGELTAGIAHEIQNPLNFVNNFSEVSSEIISELHEEIDNQNWQEVKHISEDLKTNLEKIKHHGQRASNIVKGMLEHSRVSSGIKEEVDLNKLAEEYLNLAYHGMRAHDKTFNTSISADLEPNLPKIQAVSQDIARVILNLINNAFQALDEKSKNDFNQPFKPLLKVSTRSDDQYVKLIVSDNAAGIPESIKEKIFQPFFTTKPSGKGTGLGLSLSYDIISAHGGEISFSSNVIQGTEFVISLPYKKK